jgi:PAS domain S-box-containing protein
MDHTARADVMWNWVMDKKKKLQSASRVKTKCKTGGVADLRRKARKQLSEQSSRFDSLSRKGMKDLVNELGTHQIELEMQNEELRRAGREIETSQAKYADLYDFSPVGYFTFDRNGLIQELNLTGANVLGMEKRFLLTKPFRTFIEPADRDVFHNHLLAVFTTHTNQTCQITIRKRDGSVSYVQLHSLSFRMGEADPGVCRTAVSDVTEWKRAEEALRQSEIRFKTIFENSVDAVGLSKNGKHVLVNPSYLVLYGYSSNNELEGKSILDLIALGERERIREYVHARGNNGTYPTEYETRGLKKDGTEFIMDVKVTTFTLAPDIYTLVIIRDITERRKAEDGLKQAGAELAAVNRDLEAFSYAVSHDLRAPLRSIEGFTDAILEDHVASLDETAKDYFQRVTSASRRMSQLIDAMLNMARLTRTELNENSVNLSDVAEVAAHKLRTKEPGRKVEFIIAKGVKARGDISLLNAVMENLFGNSWKFSAKKPFATIEFGSTLFDGKEVYFVRDDGAGFSMKYADKLFTPFRRLHTETEFPGIGIGLATVQRIIHRHGGRIWAEGELEKGATFYFTLN